MATDGEERRDEDSLILKYDRRTLSHHIILLGHESGLSSRQLEWQERGPGTHCYVACYQNTSTQFTMAFQRFCCFRKSAGNDMHAQIYLHMYICIHTSAGIQSRLVDTQRRTRYCAPKRRATALLVRLQSRRDVFLRLHMM